jgi:hypothetical protein
MILPLTLRAGRYRTLSTESCRGRGGGGVRCALAVPDTGQYCSVRPIVRNPAGVDRPSASYCITPLAHFAVSQFFISPAMRRCAAFLMASDRFNPGGNFGLCQSFRCPGSPIVTIDILARQFCHVIVLTSSGRRYLRLVDKAALSAPQGPVLEPRTCGSNILDLHARLAFRTTRPPRHARR